MFYKTSFIPISDGEAVSEEDESGEEEHFDDGEKTEAGVISKKKIKGKKSKKNETESPIRYIFSFSM